MMNKTSFEGFATEYDLRMGDDGDYIHKETIDKSLFKLVGSPKNKIFYDIGCGNGYIARKLVKAGAQEVWASDISPTLISLAKNKYKSINIKYLVQDGSDFKKLPTTYFDIVIMNMTIHYIYNLNKLFRNIYKILKPAGRLIFTSDHPFHSLYYLDIGKIKDAKEVIIDARRYNEEHITKVRSPWDKTKYLMIYRRPFSLFISLLSKNKLLVDGLIEPYTKRKPSRGKPDMLESLIPSKFAMSAIKI